jgi:hypothetical protein
LTPAALPRLQQTIGNRAVQRLIASYRANTTSVQRDPAHPAAGTCRPLSLEYANESTLACPAGKCGAKFKFDVTKVNTCSGDDCQGQTVGETVTTDNKCTAGGVDQGPCPNPVAANNAIPHCGDTYSFCTDPANIPDAGCTETYTVRDKVGDTSAGVCKIIWKFTKKDGNCSATVTRNCTPASSSQCATGHPHSTSSPL